MRRSTQPPIPGAGKSFRTLIATVLDSSGAKPGVGPGAAEIGRLAPPTLWIWGDADTFADAGFPSRVRAALPSAEVVVLHGAGHTPWLDDPKAVAERWSRFSTGWPRRQHPATDKEAPGYRTRLSCR